MNLRNSLFLLLASAFIGTSLSAATITQTTPFDFTMSGGPTDGTFTIVPEGSFTATVNPFDSGNGTLNSFEVMWSINVEADGISASDTGGFGTSVGGSYLLGGVAYAGNGGGDGDGNSTGLPVSFTFSVPEDDLFLVSNSGVSYNPALLASVTGGSPFDLLWGTDYSLSPQGLSSWNASATGNVSIIYDYDPAPAPEPSTFVLFGGGILALAGFKRYRG